LYNLVSKFIFSAAEINSLSLCHKGYRIHYWNRKQAIKSMMWF